MMPLGKILSPSTCVCCWRSLVYKSLVASAGHFLHLWAEVLELLLCFECVGDEGDEFDGDGGEFGKEAHPRIAACRGRKVLA